MLKTLTIQLQHQVPPQHMIENSAGARNLDQEQISWFEKYGPLKKGSYTREEDKIIKKNWNMFCTVSLDFIAMMEFSNISENMFHYRYTIGMKIM